MGVHPADLTRRVPTWFSSPEVFFYVKRQGSCGLLCFILFPDGENLGGQPGRDRSVGEPGIHLTGHVWPGASSVFAGEGQAFSLRR